MNNENKPYEVRMNGACIEVTPSPALPQYKLCLTFERLNTACIVYQALGDGEIGVEISVPEHQYILNEL